MHVLQQILRMPYINERPLTQVLGWDRRRAWRDDLFHKFDHCDMLCVERDQH
jgi:hypothetical protein